MKIEINIKDKDFSLEKTLKTEQCSADLWYFDFSQNGWVSYLPLGKRWRKIILKEKYENIVAECFPPLINIFRKFWIMEKG